MRPEKALPLPAGFSSTEAYVESLLCFGTASPLLKTLCGGVHVLDFFTRCVDVYESIFSESWRYWFKSRDIMDILDLFMREDVEKVNRGQKACSASPEGHWRGGPPPPTDLVEYVRDVRSHCLQREFLPQSTPSITRHVAVGMKRKKVHEVSNFACYVDRLTSDIEACQEGKISHLVDFGSGMNYLGRTISTTYNRNIIAVESRGHNIEGARDKDVLAKIAQKPKLLINKKAYRAAGLISRSEQRKMRILANNSVRPEDGGGRVLSNETESMDNDSGSVSDSECSCSASKNVHNQGNMTYVTHRIENGDLSAVLKNISVSSQTLPPDGTKQPSLLTLSLHSCGNLLHHGLRTILNPNVKAVALVGCCYNLLTERLGPPSFKLPGLQLRSNHPRLEETSSACDPHGFPMSQHYAEYQSEAMTERGVRLNITARNLAVQAPDNWTAAESDAFFTRHFYRAVLSRIFVDYGIVPAPDGNQNTTTEPVIIGALRKACYSSFLAYVRGAVEKLTGPNSPSPAFRDSVAEKLAPHILTDEVIEEYARNFGPRKHDLAVTWSLMAFSAKVIESMIVVDRWLWLMEQDEVEKAWVEPVFDHKESPRNLVIVGVKKNNS